MELEDGEELVVVWEEVVVAEKKEENEEKVETVINMIGIKQA